MKQIKVKKCKYEELETVLNEIGQEDIISVSVGVNNNYLVIYQTPKPLFKIGAIVKIKDYNYSGKIVCVHLRDNGKYAYDVIYPYYIDLPNYANIDEEYLSV